MRDEIVFGSTLYGGDLPSPLAPNAPKKWTPGKTISFRKGKPIPRLAQEGEATCYLYAPLQLIYLFEETHPTLAPPESIPVETLPIETPIKADATDATDATKVGMFYRVWDTYKEHANIDHNLTHDRLRNAGYTIPVLKSFMHHRVLTNVLMVEGNNFADKDFLTTPYYMQVAYKFSESKASIRNPLKWHWQTKEIGYHFDDRTTSIEEFASTTCSKHFDKKLKLIGGLLSFWLLEDQKTWTVSQTGHVIGFTMEDKHQTQVQEMVTRLEKARVKRQVSKRSLSSTLPKKPIYTSMWYDTASETNAEYEDLAKDRNGIVEEVILFYENTNPLLQKTNIS